MAAAKPSIAKIAKICYNRYIARRYIVPSQNALLEVKVMEYNTGRRGTGRILSLSEYNIAIGAVLFWGFLVNALLVKFCTPYFAQMNYLLVLIVYFIMCIIGIVMSRKSDDPVISFIGYNFVVLPVGVVLALLLQNYDSVSILHAAAITACVTGVMLVAAALAPRIFLSLGKVLFVALIAVIVIELICMLFKIYMPTFWDWIVALIFCGYIGFDWAVAQEKRHTMDNAIDSCVGLYLDIINLFIRILSITGNRSSRD